ncbi:MAG: formylglycine-generating enzyme family protein [Bacteroidales bacterium]|jgi:alpha-galactosidase|nr:formylglycine-generating enzyme family protein [Bacteroidales bacterium]
MCNKIVFFLIGVVTAGMFSSCHRQEITGVVIGETAGVKVTGIGVEFDPHFFSLNVPRGASEADWKTVERRIAQMGIERFRVMAMSNWFEPENDNNNPAVINRNNLTFQSEEMKSLYRLLDLAQANNVRVTVVLWSVENSFQPKNDEKRVNFDEWCESFSILMQHLLLDKKYTCIEAITPLNEPNSQISIDDYIVLCKKLDARFRKDNIRQRLLFNLSDNTYDAEFLRRCTEELAGIADLFNSHCYDFGPATPNSDMLRWEKRNKGWTDVAGKPHFVGEFGSNQMIGYTRQKDMDSFERGVFLTRTTLNFLNGGATGVSYWCLFDQYYGSSADEDMMQCGLWRFKKDSYVRNAHIRDDYAPRPQYYAYSLLTRFIRSGAEIYPMDLKDDFIAGTAFKDVENKWTYVIANASGRDLPLSVKNDADAEFEVYRYEENALPADDGMIPPAGETVVSVGKQLEVHIAARSVAVYRQISRPVKPEVPEVEMVFVKGGNFSMGGGAEQGKDAYADEKPVRPVTLNDFYIGKYEITQAQWQSVTGNNPSLFKGERSPVERVTWEEVQEFIEKLNGKTGKKYRLPTEAEWEYAARGGAQSKGYRYSGSNNIDEVAWYGDNSEGRTHAVGLKKANELGIFDMSGNVCEWCADWYEYYPSEVQKNPQGPASGYYKVLRGGNYFEIASQERSTFRYGCTLGFRWKNIGFRLVMDAE